MKSSKLDSEVKQTVLRYKNICQQHCRVDQNIFAQKQAKGSHEDRKNFFPQGIPFPQAQDNGDVHFLQEARQTYETDDQHGKDFAMNERFQQPATED